jgi:hypothetical protein
MPAKPDSWPTTNGGVNGFLGGMFGEGLDRNITDAYQWLVDNYEAADDISIYCHNLSLARFPPMPASFGKNVDTREAVTA